MEDCINSIALRFKCHSGLLVQVETRKTLLTSVSCQRQDPVSFKLMLQLRISH